MCDIIYARLLSSSPQYHIFNEYNIPKFEQTNLISACKILKCYESSKHKNLPKSLHFTTRKSENRAIYYVIINFLETDIDDNHDDEEILVIIFFL